MILKTFKLIDPQGFNAGPVGLFAKEAASFASSVLIQSGEFKGNAKSVMSIMDVEISFEDSFDLLVEGPDEEEAVVAIEKVMKECGIV